MANILILFGSGVWIYITGAICGVVSTIDKDGMAFRNMMDDLNYFIADRRLDKQLSRRLR